MLLDLKFVGLLSVRLDRFKEFDRNKFNFRCPICGDSKKDTSKTRGYIFPHPKHPRLVFKCHNCGETKSIQNLLRDQFPDLYKEYLFEKLGGSKKSRAAEDFKMKNMTFKKPVVEPKKANKHLDELWKVSDLESTHFCKEFVQERKIPSKYHRILYFAPKFKQWVNSVIPGKFNEPIKMDEPRLLIPIFDEQGNMIAFQGRALNYVDKAYKYITIKLDENGDKFYGRERVDKKKTVIIVEGPIDSLFLSNSVAACGSDLKSINYPDSIYCLDCEPRNKDIVKKVDKLIKAGKTVCLLSPNKYGGKDINDLILEGLTPKEIEKLIKENSYQGMKARVVFSNWRRI